MTDLTYGEKAVGIDDAPNEGVEYLKRRYAELIDMHHAEALDENTGPEAWRLHNEAITRIQDAALWSVKAAGL